MLISTTDAKPLLGQDHIGRGVSNFKQEKVAWKSSLKVLGRLNLKGSGKEKSRLFGENHPLHKYPSLPDI